jgi:hypothetical protein
MLEKLDGVHENSGDIRFKGGGILDIRRRYQISDIGLSVPDIG